MTMPLTAPECTAAQLRDSAPPHPASRPRAPPLRCDPAPGPKFRETALRRQRGFQHDSEGTMPRLLIMKSWLPIPVSSHFSLKNIPFGIISTASNVHHRPAVAVGEHVLDLSAFTSGAGFSKLAPELQSNTAVFAQPTLNAFAALGRPYHRAIRQYLQDVFREDTPYPELLQTNDTLRQTALVALADAQTHLPLSIGDYTDFFAGRNHAFNVGTLFRGPANALQPNYNHLPVAYHGRASSVVVSGTPLRRPWGQALPAPGATAPVFRPCARLDIELEMGMFVCRGNALGAPVAVADAEYSIFGYGHMNDWSERDIQSGSTAWVVLADALEPFRTRGLENETPLQPYLQEDRTDNILDVQLEVSVTTAKGHTTKLTKTSSKNLLWSWPQMLAHHTISGCNLRAGDLFGSGTVSGFDAGTHGSFLEQTQGGKVTIKLEGGEERKFVEDGDTITITGWAGSVEGELVGFGECVGQILPAVARS
ncbi:fumarylacetoacetase [Verticillium alfalfae VaMs.102]|uniref:Fumarylacetoacetase n=1 Tax=Verticillium alfalfae (strain VaMs.102 / ATCC MYA-4576 / FGSC 10136) TaxID=526221 RepID=C9SW92_VERA1|nr:fumarylacetoacetase [Verticillium alfalfae VaMs.102]EEY23057.1 fumarylacetoacetase [Verticillium alfalfae VaMs.102]